MNKQTAVAVISMAFFTASVIFPAPLAHSGNTLKRGFSKEMSLTEKIVKLEERIQKYQAQINKLDDEITNESWGGEFTQQNIREIDEKEALMKVCMQELAILKKAQYTASHAAIETKCLLPARTNPQPSAPELPTEIKNRAEEKQPDSPKHKSRKGPPGGPNIQDHKPSPDEPAG